MKELDEATLLLFQAARQTVDLAAKEAEQSAWPASHAGPPTSGGPTSDPTGTVATLGRHHDYGRLIDAIHKATRTLQRTCETVATERTGPCTTPGCQGDGITRHDGRCDRCGRWMRHNPGTPDMMVGDDGRTLVDDWNDRRPRECACPSWCCPDGCLDLVAASKENPLSDRCADRMTVGCRCDPSCHPDGCPRPPEKNRRVCAGCRKDKQRRKRRSA